MSHGPVYTISAAWTGTQIGRPSAAEIQRAFDAVARARLLPRVGGSQPNDWGGWYTTQDNVNAPAATIDGPRANGALSATGRWMLGDTEFARMNGPAMAAAIASQLVANLNALHGVDDWNVSAALAVPADPPSLNAYVEAPDVAAAPPPWTVPTHPGVVPLPDAPYTPTVAPRAPNLVPWMVVGGVALVAAVVIATRSRRA